MRILATFFSLFISLSCFAQSNASESKSQVQVPAAVVESNEQVVAPDKKARVEKLEVTGSHIKRIDVEGPSPVLTIDEEDLIRSGYNSVSDVLRDAGVSQFGSFREAGGQSGAGTAAVDLRGLGQVRTLVLLNGQRLPTDAINGSVDMNMIPMAAVQRIDVLKDGASAIYGSDALGGVVNIITKKEFDGHEVAGSYSMTELGGGSRRELSHTYGAGGATWRFINILYLRSNERVLAEDREWSKQNYSSIGSPGSYSTDGGTTWKPDPSCPAAQIDPSTNRCLFNFGAEKWEMPEMKQMAWMSEGQMDFTESLTGIVRLGYNYKEVDWQRAPLPVTGLTMTAPAELGADAGTPNISMRYRFRELGNRKSHTTNGAASALVGAKGYVGDSWDWQANLSFNRVDRTETRTGYALTAELQNLIDSNSYNPFATGTKGDLSALFYEPEQKNVSENTFVEFKTTGDLAEFSAGTLSVAFGSQMTRELYRDSADARSLNNEISTIATSAGGGDRNAISVFSEFGLSLFESFETQAALRYDHYDGFGGSVNPKLAFRYAATKELVFRTSAGTGFKAPQMQKLFTQQLAGQRGFKDYVYCDKTGGAACSTNPYNTVVGGNPNLKEERSFSANVGTVYEPVRKHNFSMDWWYYNLQDLVEEADFALITKAELEGKDISEWGAIANRNPVTGELIGVGLYAPYLNIASTETQGLDFSYNGRFKTGWGDFKVRFNHSHMIYYKTETLPGAGINDRVGIYGRPQWRNNTLLTYIPSVATEYGLLFRTLSKNSKADSTKGAHPTYTEIDFTYSYMFESLGGRLTAGIKNILGSTPPYDDSVAVDADINFRLYNPRGRSAYLGYRQSF